MLDYIKDYEQEMIESNEMKEVMEMSLNSYISDLQSQLPPEPLPNSGNSVEITIFHPKDNQTFSRNFNTSDRIIHIKNFMKTKIRTYDDIKLVGKTNNKIYVKDDETLEEAGIQPNQKIELVGYSKN
jgi:hypothetical protein